MTLRRSNLTLLSLITLVLITFFLDNLCRVGVVYPLFSLFRVSLDLTLLKLVTGVRHIEDTRSPRIRRVGYDG